MTGNRWGKSFVCAVKIIHHAIYRPRPLRYDISGKYRVVTASITQDQANIVFDQVVRLTRQSKYVAQLVASQTRTPYPKLVLGNGSMIEARSTQNRGEYLLGHDYDLFVFDEVAFETEPDYVVEEVIRMRLADRAGKLDLVSTPNGKNWFYRRSLELASSGRKGYTQAGDSRENKFISEDYLKERIECFSDRRVEQNIRGQFVDSGGEILRGAYVDDALSRYKKRQPSEDKPGRYLSGWDLARKQTATVGITVRMEGDQVEIVQLERFRLFDWRVVIDSIKKRQRDYPGQLIVDATGLGDVVVEQLREYNPLAVIFSSATKSELLANVEILHAQDRICYQRWELPDGSGRIWSLEDELRQARWDDNNRCDGLMALALAVWPLRRRPDVSPMPRVGRI